MPGSCCFPHICGTASTCNSKLPVIHCRTVFPRRDKGDISFPFYPWLCEFTGPSSIFLLSNVLTQHRFPTHQALHVARRLCGLKPGYFASSLLFTFHTSYEPLPDACIIGQKNRLLCNISIKLVLTARTLTAGIRHPSSHLCLPTFWTAYQIPFFFLLYVLFQSFIHSFLV